MSGWVHLITFLTVTFVAAHLVDADLAAGFGAFTLIDIFTSSFTDQVVPSWTQALVAELQVVANVRAAPVVVETLVGAALPERLVRPIPAVPPVVTNSLHAHALPAATLEPFRTLAVARVDTADFIAHVSAVVMMVALVAAVDARTVAAFKLIRTTGGMSTAGFIGSIEAVSVSVTLPADMDALPAATLIFLGGALVDGGAGGGPRGAVLGPLVRAVGAVRVAVAGPQLGHTNGVVALEGRGAAGDRRAGGLVAAVITVLVFVTHEGRGDALAGLAAKLGVCALFGSTVLFIISIHAVSFSITAPGARYAQGDAACAPELCWFARFGHAVTGKFICAVSAVICPIAHPHGCDAFPIPTLELPGLTR